MRNVFIYETPAIVSMKKMKDQIELQGMGW